MNKTHVFQPASVLEIKVFQAQAHVLQGPKYFITVLKVAPASQMKFKNTQETWNKLKIKVIGVGTSNSPLQCLNTSLKTEVRG